MRACLLSVLFLFVACLTASDSKQEPAATKAKPTIVAFGSSKMSSSVIPPVIPDTIRLKGVEFEILTVENYTGKLTWHVTYEGTFTAPIKILKLEPGQVVPGLLVGTTDVDFHTSPKNPSIMVIAPGKGIADIAAWGIGADGAPSLLSSFKVQANLGPQPPPTPVDPPKPAEKSPFGNAPGLHVLIVFQDLDSRNYPITQQSVLFGETVETYLRAKCAKDASGNPQRRVYDADIDTTNVPQLWKDAFNYVKEKKRKLPWIVVGNGDKWEERELPTTVPDTMTLLTKYGG